VISPKCWSESIDKAVGGVGAFLKGPVKKQRLLNFEKAQVWNSIKITKLGGF